ncbi:MAG: efflux transporter periplasmic adaptor subunit [Flavobacteriaceae bacterium]|nr:efflux transporter periplasmic adaptor subunit [Flavobacteriaceae bacterium]|tara:strand:+ start:16255 stop:17376 length:1122 start_codon:yes stop_codon:yes gene_type:complete
MNNIKTPIAFTVFFLLLVGCADSKQQPSNTSQLAPYPVVEIPTKEVISYSVYPTQIEGTVNSEVRAKVSGYIQQVLIDEGEKVTKGQPLFRLETQSLSQDAEAAKASVNAAQVEVDKLIPLVEKNIISAVQLETAKANLAQAKSTYNSVVANIGYATVRSPINGYVGAINFREGSLVSSTNTNPLTTVASIEKVYAYFSMNEADYLNFLEKTEGTSLQDKINNFPKVELLLINGQTYKQKGTIETVTGQIDPNTGTVSFRAVFENPNLLLTNGNSGEIKIPTVYESAVVVPQSATYEQQGNSYLFTVGEENKVVSKLIQIKDKTKLLYIIDSGVKEGDLMVVKGIGKLKDGTPIQPQKVAFDSIVKPLNSLFQ